MTTNSCCLLRWETAIECRTCLSVKTCGKQERFSLLILAFVCGFCRVGIEYVGRKTEAQRNMFVWFSPSSIYNIITAPWIFHHLGQKPSRQNKELAFQSFPLTKEDILGSLMILSCLIYRHVSFFCFADSLTACVADIWLLHQARLLIVAGHCSFLVGGQSEQDVRRRSLDQAK